MKTGKTLGQSLDRTLVALLLTGLTAAPILKAAPIYSDSFDYGDADVTIGSLPNWNSGSGVLLYDADGGLAHPSLQQEKGGSMWLNYDEPRSATDSSINLDFDVDGLSPGDEVWLSSLFQYVSGSGSQIIRVTGGAVSALGFTIDGDGDVLVRAADSQNSNGDDNGDIGTGVNVGSSGSTPYLMLLRATIGTNSWNNSGSPDSVVEFWFDPVDTSSVGALGAADWTSTGGVSKFGRSTDSFSSIFAQPTAGGRIDEIRLGTSLVEVTGVIPEPGTLLVAALGSLMIVFRRK